MAKYLDDKGLKTFTTKMKGYADGKVGAVDSKVTSHINDKSSNPHGVTKTQVGLDKVDNVKQIPWSQRGTANGVATLDDNGKIPVAQMPKNGEVSASLYKIVDALPTTGIDTSKIYLVPAESFTTNNYKTEYIYLGDPNKAYDESKWEKIGDEKTNNITPTPGGSITIETAFSTTSPNPIANKTITAKFIEVEDKLAKKVESSDYTTKMTTIDSTLEDLKKKETITVDPELMDSVNPVQNKAVNSAVQDLNRNLNAKANDADLTTAKSRIDTLENKSLSIDDITLIPVTDGNGIASITKQNKKLVITQGNFVTSLTGYVSKNTLETTLANYVKSTELTKYYTIAEIDGKGYLTEHQSLANYATQKWVGDNFAKGTIPTQTSQLENNSGFLTTQSLAGYVNDVKTTEVTNGNGIASIVKSGNALNVTQGAFLTGTPNGTLFEEESTTETGKGIVDVFLRGNVLCKIKGTFITKSTLGDSIDSYMKDKSYLTEDNLNEKLKETVTIKLVSDKSESDTGLVGATVTVKSGDTTVSTQTWQGSPISVKVPCDKEVTIEAGVKKMYMKPKALAYEPSPLYNREVTFTYKALETGTYIIDKNDNLYKTTKLFQASGVAYDDALGVLLVTDSIAIVIARTVINEKAWSTGTGLVEGCTTTTDSYSTAIKDFAGAANTAAIIKKHNALDEAAASCNRYIFKNGKKGYLMSVGEALAIQANIDTIGRLLVDIDTGSGNVMSSSEDYWTSTQYDASRAYYVTMSSKRPSSSLKENRRDVVPIYSLYD